MHSVANWTHTDLGTPVPLFSSHGLEDLRATRPILLMGGVHGDEPLGVELAEKTLRFLREDAGPNVSVPWILIPCLNVDGYAGGTRVNGRGVDLNRNYPSRSWSPHFEKERYNPGPRPGSEAEISAVVGLIRDTRPRLLIHCHSWKPMVVCAGAPGLKDAERLARASGYKIEAEIGYPTPGSLSEFGWVDLGIPVICIEEADETPITQVWSNFASGLREIFLDPSSR